MPTPRENRVATPGALIVYDVGGGRTSPKLVVAAVPGLALGWDYVARSTKFVRCRAGFACDRVVWAPGQPPLR